MSSAARLLDRTIAGVTGMYLVTSRVVPLVSANQGTGPGQPTSARCGKALPQTSSQNAS